MITDFKKTVDLESVKVATVRAELVIDQARAAVVDRKRGTRIQQSLCPACFYFLDTQVACQGFTVQACGLCGKDQTLPTTAAVVLCEGCAKAKKLCKRCGCDIDLKDRTSL